MTLREEILSSVQNGKKAIDLFTEFAKDYTHDQIQYEIEEMIHEKKMIELEYELPNMEYRIKSIYFPFGTAFNFRGR